LPAPDRTPPSITITPAALKMIRQAIADAGGEVALLVDIDRGFRTRLNLGPADADAIAVDIEGVRVQFDLAGARRAQGLTIDFAADMRGQGLGSATPHPPMPVPPLRRADAAAKVRAGELVLVEVRPPDERAIASVPVAFRTF